MPSMEHGTTPPLFQQIEQRTVDIVTKVLAAIVPSFRNEERIDGLAWRYAANELNSFAHSLLLG